MDNVQCFRKENFTRFIIVDFPSDSGRKSVNVFYNPQLWILLQIHRYPAAKSATIRFIGIYCRFCLPHWERSATFSQHKLTCSGCKICTAVHFSCRLCVILTNLIHSAGTVYSPCEQYPTSSCANIAPVGNSSKCSNYPNTMRLTCYWSKTFPFNRNSTWTLTSADLHTIAMQCT